MFESLNELNELAPIIKAIPIVKIYANADSKPILSCKVEDGNLYILRDKPVKSFLAIVENYNRDCPIKNDGFYVVEDIKSTVRIKIYGQNGKHPTTQRYSGIKTLYVYSGVGDSDERNF